MAHAKTLPPPRKSGWLDRTLNRHFDVLAQILARAEDDGIPLDPKVKPKNQRGREKRRSRDKRTAFFEPVLTRLFRHTIWTGCKSVQFRNRPGTRIIKDRLYWVLLIAAFGGARPFPAQSDLLWSNFP
jgi:hypothetical protein